MRIADRASQSFTGVGWAAIIRLMKPDSCHVRRATIEDLDSLRLLWAEERLPVEDLERRLKEIHVAVNEAGALLGAVAFEVAGAHGRIHSEAFWFPEHEDMVRPMLWEHLQVLAHNFGLERMWTAEESPFWRHYVGFREAMTEDAAHLPAHFQAHSARLHVLRLRDASHLVEQAEAELRELQAAQQRETARLMRRAQLLRMLALAVAILLFGLMIMAAVYVIRRIR